jgi:hypothetical protein
MQRLLFSTLLCAAAAFAQDYKAEKGTTPPAELNASIGGLLNPEGTKISKDAKPLAEIWLRKDLPKGSPVSENNLTMPNVPHGALLGVIRFDQQHADRRGQPVKPGLYTMRYSYFPENGNHQGAAPQRDFLLLTPLSGDTDGAALPNFEALMVMSRKASGTPHPSVFSFWKEDPKNFKAGGFEKQGEHDWVLMRTIGDVPVSIILAGIGEG